MAEFWNDYWWIITTLLLFININFIGWGARHLRAIKSRQLTKEISNMLDIEDDFERTRARASIEPIDTAYFDNKEAIAAINSIPWLLHIIIFLLVAIYMKLP